MTLATINVQTPGWVTVGQPLPRGLVSDHLQLGSLATQNDVKCRWDDGSLKHVLLTALLPTAGFWPVEAGGSPLPPVPLPPPPTLTVYAQQGGTWWAARLHDVGTTGDFFSRGRWLEGGACVEGRDEVPFVDGDGNLHPWLRCLFDVRYHANGGVRVAVIVENCLEGAPHQSYALHVLHNHEVQLYGPQWQEHGPGARYRVTFRLGGLTEGFALPDWGRAVEAGAVPRYAERSGWSAGPVPHAPLTTGPLRRWMPDTGARDELGPVPAWIAEALGGDGAGLARGLAVAENCSGAWYTHVRKPDGSLPTIDERPQWRFMPHVDPADPNFYPDHEHQPDLASVAYLATGERYFAEEVAFWANFCLAHTHLSTRGGSAGLMVGEETRGEAWGLRNVLTAAFLLPDADPLKPYFADKARNNLSWWGNFQRVGPGPMAWGVRWHGTFPEHGRQCVRVWSYSYLAFVLRDAERMGFGGLANDWLDAWLNFIISWLVDPIHRQWAAAYTLPVDGGDAPGDYSGVWHDPADWPKAHYWPDVLLSVTVAEERGDPRAADARRWIEQHARPEPSFASRPHFNVLPRSVPVPEPPEPPPPDPVPEEPPVPVWPEDSLFEKFAGFSAGLTQGDYNLFGGRYEVEVGKPFGLRLQGPGLEGGTPLFTWQGQQLAWPPYGGLAFEQPGPKEIALSTNAGEHVLRVLATGPLQFSVEKSLVSTSLTGPVTDDCVGCTYAPGGDRYFFFSAPGANLVHRFRGTEDEPFASGEHHTTTLVGAPEGLAVSGPVHRDDATGLLLMATLHQRKRDKVWALDSKSTHYYGEGGLCVSRDDGLTWAFNGLTWSHAAHFINFERLPHHYGNHAAGGQNLLFGGDGFLYRFPPQVNGPTLRSGDMSNCVPMGALRADYQAVINAVAGGQPTGLLWRKLWQGEWTEPWDGKADVVCPLGGYGGNKVVWCDHLQVYLCLYSCYESSHLIQLAWAESPLGPWTPSGTVYHEDRPGWACGGANFITPSGSVGKRFQVWVPTWQEVLPHEAQLRRATVQLA